MRASLSATSTCSVDGVLVLAQPVVELVDRPAPVVRLELELLERARERIARARLELLAEPDRRRALLVDRGVELVGLGADLRLDVGDALAHPLLQRRDGALERVLRALEVRLPCAQPLLDALLDRGNELGHALGQLALADGELASSLIGEPALLGHVRRHAVRLRPRDRDAELLGLRGRLLLGSGADSAPRFGHELLGARARARERRSERYEDRAQEQRGDERGRRGSRRRWSRHDSRVG